MNYTGSFNLPFPVRLTKRVPVETRLVATTTESLNQEPNAFGGLGPIWVESEQWFYYFSDETTYHRWPIGDGTGSVSNDDVFLYEKLSITYNGQVSMSINMNYNSKFLLIENLTFKKGLAFNESINGLQKYVTWNESLGILEPTDEVILVYTEN